MVVSSFLTTANLSTSERKAENSGPVRGSGNFLRDRGYVDPEETKLKYLICNEIAVLAERKELTQAKVAEISGLAQPDVSRIVNANVKDFSVWRLMRVLTSLGKDIVIQISDAKCDHGEVFTSFAEHEPEPERGPAPSF